LLEVILIVLIVKSRIIRENINDIPYFKVGDWWDLVKK